MNEGKVKNLRMYFVYALGYRLMQLAAKRMGNEGLHRFGGGHFFTFGDWLHSVSKVRVRILFVETRKRKVSSKVSSNETSQPTTHPTHQTNQPVKKQKLRRAQGGERIY
jgi:hypothetical protein